MGRGVTENLEEGPITKRGSQREVSKEWDKDPGAELEKRLDEGVVTLDDMKNYSRAMNKAIDEYILNGDMHGLSEVLRITNPLFDEKIDNQRRFLAGVVDQGGNFIFKSTPKDHEDAVLDYIHSNIDVESIAMSQVGDDPRLLSHHAQGVDSEVEGAADFIMHEILVNPTSNPYIDLTPINDYDKWSYEQNKENIINAWVRSGGSEDFLEQSSPLVDILDSGAADLGYQHLPPADIGDDVEVFSDDKSDKFFVDPENDRFYGNKRSYVIGLDGEKKEVNVTEARDADGRALRLSCGDIHVDIVETAGRGKDKRNLVKYDIGDGPVEATPSEVASGIEKFAIGLIKGSLSNPDSQSDRLFQKIK